ncbi:MAG: hypothetical protein FD146_541 [Anaerolineaceae bacterium]|nr:MAG: hypothetical protein FD146_541 [Anaerolineaceae bacterium]
MAAPVKTRFVVLALALCLAAVSCGPVAATNPPDTDLVATIVAATFQALTAPAPLGTPTLSSAPPPAGATATPSLTAAPSATATPGLGSLSGGVYGYPYGTIPRLVFVAFNQETGYWKYWINLAGASYYSTDSFIPAGRYQVVAYDASGHAGGCVTIVTVKANENAVCDITDWVGSYPGKPAGAPNP